MGKPTAFLELLREDAQRRPPHERVRDYGELEGKLGKDSLRAQASRCMDCGVPFCHSETGCPLGNLIPEWNDLVYRGRMREAIARLHATNNFPEFTGRVCPAPCEAACVLSVPAVGKAPVTIKQVEKQIIDHAFAEGWIVPEPAPHRSGKRVVVIGSGPAGLACAQQLARMGHAVTVLERSDRIGGLMRYGIPDFKLEKDRIDRRLAQLTAEGVELRVGVEVGTQVSVAELRRDFDAVVIAVGASQARDLQIPGRELHGIHLAMDYLTLSNKRLAGDEVQAIDARGKHVVILGGGDTGSDCLGTALRQGAASVTQLELMPQPPLQRAPENPWPQWPLVFRTSSSQEEGGAREFGLLTKRFCGVGRVQALETVRFDGKAEIAGSNARIACDLVLLAMGFSGVERRPWLDELGAHVDGRGNIDEAPEGVFVCGDARRGASLVVWAIAEGRKAAAEVDRALQRVP